MPSLVPKFDPFTQFSYQPQIGYGIYPVYDVASFILKWFVDNKDPITNLHLQGILYFLWIDYYGAVRVGPPAAQADKAEVSKPSAEGETASYYAKREYNRNL